MATQPAPAGSSERVGPLLGRYVALLRPHQWVKNLAIFPPVVFSFGLFDPTILVAAGLGFVSLCLTSSSVYALNDVCDAESDARHPRKRLRPVAAGAIPKGLALALSAALALVGLAVAYSVNWWLASVVAIYWSTILLYSLALKRVALLDVMTIGIGFVLRVIAGAVVSLTPPSNWLLLVALFLALLLALGKRRQELQVQSHIAGTSRPVLRDYDLQMVNQVLAVLAGLVIMSYSLFTVSEYAQARFQSGFLIYTVPFVIYAVFRYLHLMYRGAPVEDPSLLFLKDRPLLTSAVLWIIASGLAIHWPQLWPPV